MLFCFCTHEYTRLLESCSAHFYRFIVSACMFLCLLIYVIIERMQNPGDSFADSFLLWSAIPGSYDDSHGGILFLYTIASLASAKRKVWVVLMDRSLMIYRNTVEMDPVETLVLKHCVFAKTEEGIMSVTRQRSPTGSWHLYAPVKQQENIWCKLLEDMW